MFAIWWNSGLLYGESGSHENSFLIVVATLTSLIVLDIIILQIEVAVCLLLLYLYVKAVTGS